ncbi:hypothetical protein C0J52_03508 [Blattella germanica]|nr:hypothetical protein C0J52_03508 [Blattella germanica]
MERKQGKPLQSDARQMVINVQKFCTEEYDALKVGKPSISVADITGRTVAATGVSRRTVYRILDEKKKSDVAGCVLSTPGKKRPSKTPTKTVVDSFSASAIRRTVYSLYRTHFLPSLNDTRKALKEADLFHGSKWALREVLRSLKFRYVSNNQGRKFLMERSEVVCKRYNFLRKMKEADVAKHNLSFKTGNVKTLFETAVSKVTMENWKSACDHVKSVEKFYWEKDGLVNEVVDRLCINLEDSDNDEEEQEEDCSEEGNSATALSSSNIPGISPLSPSP